MSGINTRTEHKCLRKAVILLTSSLLLQSCEKKPTDHVPKSKEYQEYHAPSNEVPVASFTVTPDIGSTETFFYVDASASTDPDGSDEYLRFSWSWYHDLYPYYQNVRNSYDSTAYYQYSIEGLHTIQLTVTDPGGKFSRAERDVLVTGRTKWAKLVGGLVYVRGNVSSAAIGENSTIYLGGTNGVLYAIDPEGNTLWTYVTGDQINSSPAVADDGTICFGSYDGNVYALTSGGSLLWQYNTGDLVMGSPAIAMDGTVFIVSRDQKLIALQPDGTLRWSYTIDSGHPSIMSTPSIASDGTIYTGNVRGELYAVTPNGSLKWKTELEWGNMSSPAIGADGTIYVRARKQPLGDILYAINPDGVKQWDFPMATIYTPSPYAAPAVGEDGTIYVGSINSFVYAINPDGSLIQSK